MTKNEYLNQLGAELRKNSISDMDDIISEYEQHFAFKLADGYSEEEIAAKLGAPRAIAAQYESLVNTDKKSSGSKLLLKLALGAAAVFEVLFYITFLAWNLVLGEGALTLGTLGVCLVGGLNIAGLIPYVPYLGSLVLGISVLGLAVIFGAATVYCFAFLRQMIRASIRWHKNMTSASVLPPLPWNPQFKPKMRRGLRTVLLLALAVFGVCFVLAFVIMMLQAGTMGFWHEWSWFVS